MGRGLGKTQQAILDYLRQQGKPCWVYEIPLDLYPTPPEGETVEVPYSFYTSVRRAINALERRGLVHCGLPAKKQWRGEEHRQRMCWLSEHRAPQCKARLQSADVDRAIINRIQAALALTDQQERDFIFKATWSRKMPSPCEGAVKYGWLVDKTARDLGCSTNYDYQRFKTAINRAVNRLIDRGILTGYKRPNGWYGWIRLNHV